MLEKSSQFLSSEQRCEPKSLDVAVRILQELKNTLGKLVVIAVNLEAIWLEFWMKRAWKFSSCVLGDSQISLI